MTSKKKQSPSRPAPWLPNFTFIDQQEDYQLLLERNSARYCIVNRHLLKPIFYASFNQAFLKFLEKQHSMYQDFQ